MARAGRPGAGGSGRRAQGLIRSALAAAAALLVAPAPASGDALSEHRPLLRYDSRERIYATSLEAMTGRYVAGGGLHESNRLVASGGRVLAAANPRLGLPPLTPGSLKPRRAARGERIVTIGRPLARGRRGRPRDVVYGRRATGGDGRRWLQYWIFYEDNPQDRGIVRTGRHAGDWEFMQVGLGRGGRPERATLAQHSWAESCAWGDLERVRGAPVLYPSNGSHASYASAGTKDRPFPDPNDDADGRGRRVRPALREVGAWARWPGRFGESAENRVPGEQSSPRAPAFQADERWRDPSAYDRSARSCGSGPPGRPWQTVLVVGLAAVAVLALVLRRRRRPRLARP